MHLPRRFIDRADVKKIISETSDFYLRKERNYISWLTFAFVSAVLSILLFLHYYFSQVIVFNDHYEMTWDQWVVTGFFVLLIMMILELFVYMIIKRLKAIGLAQEFQGLLFSSAMKVHTVFTLIVHDDGDIIYCENRRRDIFNAHLVASFDQLLNHPGLAKEDSKRLSHCLSHGESMECPLKVTNKKGESHEYQLIVDPLARPTGFFVIRAY